MFLCSAHIEEKEHPSAAELVQEAEAWLAGFIYRVPWLKVHSINMLCIPRKQEQMYQLQFLVHKVEAYRPAQIGVQEAESAAGRNAAAVGCISGAAAAVLTSPWHISSNAI